jgi:hypothetical protein
MGHISPTILAGRIDMTDNNNKTDETDTPATREYLVEFWSDLEEFMRYEAVEACISKDVMP